MEGRNWGGFLPIAAVLLLVAPFGDYTQNAVLAHVVAPPERQAQTVSDMIERVVGARSLNFTVKVDPTLGPKDRDTFKLSSAGPGRVKVTGSSGAAAAWGFHYFLSQYCGGHVSWAGKQVALPSPLPALPAAGVQVTSIDKWRYYLNTCTMSYSLVWHDWPAWQEQLDWMAMNAINLPLAFVGQEAIWQRVYLKMGFTHAELDAHFAGPAFLAWQRMGNMHGWGGPLPQAWIDGQVALQHSILQRMRDFGMTPVLPAFAGHVPKNITRLFPKANVTHAGDWGGFNNTYCCTTLLDFSDPLFRQIGKNFIDEYTKEFGTNHVYNCDSFNENSPPSGDPAFIAAAGREVYAAMAAADPDAIWLMQGWLFSHSATFWRNRRAQALLTAIPQGRLMVLDMPSDVLPQYQRLHSYFGQPFIWTMLHNFGGNLAMYGAVEQINQGPFKARSMVNSSLVGTGLTMEGIYQNEVMYAFMLENTWRRQPRNITEWFTFYHRGRYGAYNEDVDRAWQLLKATVYNCTDPAERHAHGRNLVVRRPRRRRAKFDASVYNCTYPLENHGTDIYVSRRPSANMSAQQVWYDPDDLYTAWDHMVQASGNFTKSSLFRYDLVDVTRQSLQVLAVKYYADLMEAFKLKSITQTRSAGVALLSLLDAMDTVLASDTHFLLGRWLEAAKAKATTDAERTLYEYNARNQVTLWGPTGNILDYANKQWAGLMSDYYRARWFLFVTRLVESLRSRQPFNQTQFNLDVFTLVEQPFTFSNKLYTTTPIGDSLAVVRAVHARYRPVARRSANFFSKLYRRSLRSRESVSNTARWLQRNRKQTGSKGKDGQGRRWSHENALDLSPYKSRQ